MPESKSSTIASSEPKWRQRSELDTMTSLKPELEKELERLDSEFWVNSDKLKEIVARFGQELNDGLEKDGSNIPMNVTWVFGLPTGTEEGTFLALDLGGTNLRVCKVTLHGNEAKNEEKHTLDQEQYKLPEEIKSGTADELWNHVADTLETFMRDKGLDKEYSKDKPMPLGFTFSYPATQHRIDHGILQTWTKGFDISGVEGNDVAQQLRDKMTQRDLPISLIALANDTVGAMVASAYNDPDTIIGAIFGTGCNAAYMQALQHSPPSIPKLSLEDAEWNTLGPCTKVAINCEYGAFDNGHHVLPRSSYDKDIDRSSPRPGEQTFEKLSAGLYLGEILRLVLLDLANQSKLFDRQDLSKLKEPYILDTAFLSTLENDTSPSYRDSRSIFEQTLSLKPSDYELDFARIVSEMIAIRGARLCACGIAAICRKEGIQKGHVAADGSVAIKHPKFGKRWAGALGEILDWKSVGETEEGPIKLTSAEDGSGVGVAVIVAMTLERKEKGSMVGIGG